MLRVDKLLQPVDRLGLQLNWLAVGYQREYRFHPRRRWRADFFLEYRTRKLLVEVEGGAFQRGRHTRGLGFENDCEKYAEALILGFLVLRVTPRQIDRGLAIDWIRRILHGTRSTAV